MNRIDRSTSPARLDLRALMVLIGLIAVGLASLKIPNPLVASLVFSATLTTLAITPLMAIYGRPRPFWVGFSVVGWIYAVLAFAPGAWTEIRPYLLTSQLLDHTSVFFGFLDIGRPASMLNQGASPVAAGLSSWSVTNEGLGFQRIGHSLAALILGAVGGLLAVLISGRASSKASVEADSP